MQPPDLGAVPADDGRPVSVIGLGIRLEESDAILAFVDGLVDRPPVGIVGSPMPRRRGRGTGSEQEGGYREKRAPHRHGHTPLDAGS